ncbi:MAG: NAD(P)H-hydrate dehydratase [Clostridiales bacterium]|nr:NAD(P)H-hydrate dehydratase [Clostridiales bacterium]
MTDILATPVFGVLISLLAFETGLWLNRKTRLSLLNPLLIAVALIILLIQLTPLSLEDYNRGGQIISFLLAPATVALAIPLYKSIRLLKESPGPILTGIVAGSVGYHGAAVLAARAAQVARPGLISVMTIGEAYVPVASNLLSPMVHRFSRETFDKVFEKATALLIGPGLATSESRNYVYPLLQELWRTADVPMVVDASALDWIPQGDVDSEAMRIITPHAGEASRLLHRGGDMEATPNSNRLQAAEALSKMYGHCTVVLKGYQTVTFSPAHHQWFINSSGNPYLAQGGAGDVLAGLITGYLAHPASRLDRNLSLHQIIYAVWLHGWTADVLDQEGCAWTVEDYPTA